jgi:hypothetical protein
MRPVYDCMRKRDLGKHHKCDLSECPEEADPSEDQPMFGWSKAGAKEDPDYTPCSFCRGHEKFDHLFQPVVWWKLCKDQEPLMPDRHEEVQEAREKWMLRFHGNLACLYFQNEEIDTKELYGLLKYFARIERFIPRMIVLDYADNLRVAQGDKRYDAIGQSWGILRNITLDQTLGYPLLLTATQTNVKGLMAKKDIHGGHIGGSNQKLNHPTAVFAIHRNDKRLRDSDCSIFQMDRVREGAFDSRRVLVAGHLDRGRVFGPSCFYSQDLLSKTKQEEEDERK